MTPASQAAAARDFAPDEASLPGPEAGHLAHPIHAPEPGVTATLITDMRELFKVRVTGLVVITGWAGFYLGSMQSGISSVQRGLLDTLIGIGLVSAGSGALNQALERSIDAKMKRTADRPIASGRISLTEGIIAGIGALALGSLWLLLHTNLLTVSLALLTAFCYVAIYTPLKRVTTLATFIGAFPGAMGPLLGWTAARGRIGALALGSLWLLLHTNLLTVSLALLTAFCYVAIYTPLKRVTTLATFIGAFPGAMGPLLGWTAARGRIEWPAIALFAILFVWQFPHFMAIAWLYRDDYARAGIRMLPVVQPDGLSTVVEALFYAVIMIPVSLAPWKLGMAGAIYAVPATILGLFYLAYTIRFTRILRTTSETESRSVARDLLKVSVIYLPLLLTTLMVCAIAQH